MSIYDILENKEVIDVFKAGLDKYNLSEFEKSNFIGELYRTIRKYKEKIVGGYLSEKDEDDLYRDIDDLVDRVKKAGELKDKDNNNRFSNGSDKSDNSSNFKDDIDDLDKDDLGIEDYLSGSIAVKYFDEHIKEQEKVVEDLRVAVNEAKLNSRRLIKELKKQEAILEILRDQSKTLSASDSYGDSKRISRNDEKLINVNDKLRDKIDSLKIIDGINNRHVKREKVKLQKQIARLKNKQGKIMAKQSKVTNKKLVSDYKKMVHSGKKLGKEDAIEIIRDRRDDRINEAISNLDEKNDKYNEKRNNAIDNGKFIKEKLYKVPVNISQAKLNLLDKYCKLLSFKDGKVDGFRKLPDTIKNYIKDSIINNYDLVFDVGKSR